MIRVRIEYTGTPGAPYLSTLHFAGQLQADAQAAAGAAHAYLTSLAAVLNSTLTARVLPDVEHVDELTGRTAQVYEVLQDPVVGSVTGEMLPSANQGLIQWRTGVYQQGRQIRGRTFVPSPSEQANGGGRPGAGYIADCLIAADVLVDNAQAFGVYSTVYRLFTPVTSASVWTEWAVLRSRRD